MSHSRNLRSFSAADLTPSRPSTLPPTPSANARAGTYSRAGPSRSGPSRSGPSRAATSRAGPSRATSSRAAAPSGRRTRSGTANTEDEVIVAVIENNFAEVGLCAYNTNSFDVELRQISDSKSFSQLTTAFAVLDVVEIVMCDSSIGGPLEASIESCTYTRDIRRTYISRSLFNETQGDLDVQRLSVELCPYLKNHSNIPYYLALASLGALVSYVQSNSNIVLSPNTLRIVFKPNEGCTFLDMQTILGLELVQNSRPGDQTKGERRRGSLLDTVNETKTRAGFRLIRRLLLEPFSEKATIVARQNSVREVSNNEEMYTDIIGVLKGFPDLEAALSALIARERRNPRAAVEHTGGDTDSRTGPTSSRDASTGRNTGRTTGYTAGYSARAESSSTARNTAHRSAITPKKIYEARNPCMTAIKNVMVIKAAIESAVDMINALNDVETPYLKGLRTVIKFPVLRKLRDAISEVILEDAAPSRDFNTLRLRGAFAVKSDRSGRLDVSRKVLLEFMEEINLHESELQEKYPAAKMKLSITAARGYHLTVPKSTAGDLDPQEFIQITTSGHLCRFSTVKLSDLNTAFQDVLNEIWKYTDLELEDLLSVIFEPKTAIALYHLCDAFALIDLVSSFVTYCSNYPDLLIAPTMTQEGPPVVMKGAHHPVLLHMDPTTSVPNDLTIDETARLQIITGENNSGKSTLLKMAGLNTILAHTGCFVPAASAEFRIMDCVLSRFTTSDEISVGHTHSHFSKEISEIAVILDSIRPNEILIQNRLRENEGVEHTMDDLSLWTHPPGMKYHLILCDELGRSTSISDGFSIAFAVFEKMLATTGVYVLFATHFLALSALVKVYPNVRSFHMKTLHEPSYSTQGTPGGQREPGSTIPAATSVTNTTTTDVDSALGRTEFTYEKTEGVLKATEYGIETARAAGIPAEIIQDAINLKDKISISRIMDPEAFVKEHFSAEAINNARIMKRHVMIYNKIMSIKSKSMDDEDFRSKLHNFHQGYHYSMNSRRNNSSRVPVTPVTPATTSAMTMEE